MTNDNQRGTDGREIALEPRDRRGDKLSSPSVARNRLPILDAFTDLMPHQGRMLEIASGTGEHGAFVCGALPGLTWQPSDIDPASMRSIAAYAEDQDRMAAPLPLDVTTPEWWSAVDAPRPAGMVSINMIHIAPFTAAEGLFRGAAALLAPGGRLFLYGPFSRRGEMSESNRRFDGDLKRRDPSWGVRDLDDQLQPLGARFAFHLDAVRQMPANNLSVVFEKG